MHQDVYQLESTCLGRKSGKRPGWSVPRVRPQADHPRVNSAGRGSAVTGENPNINIWATRDMKYNSLDCWWFDIVLIKFLFAFDGGHEQPRCVAQQ